MDIEKTQAELELSFTRAHDGLRSVWPELTPCQQIFLLCRWLQQRYHTDGEAALALGLNPGTPYTWRWRSPTFRKAEQLMGESHLETARATWFVDLMGAYNRRFAEAMSRQRKR